MVYNEEMNMTEGLEHGPVRGWDTPAIPGYASTKEVHAEIPTDAGMLMRQSERLLSKASAAELTDTADIVNLVGKIERVQSKTQNFLQDQLDDLDVAEAVESFLPSTDATIALELWLAVRLDEIHPQGTEIDDEMYVEAQLLAEAISSVNPNISANELLDIAKAMIAEINTQKALTHIRSLVPVA